MNRLTDTRDKILDRAADLLMSHGFNGFSYRDIATHLGVKNAAVHYHFPSKSDLALALLQEYRKVLREQTSAFMSDGGPALPQIEGLFHFTRAQCLKGRCICPFGAFAVDYEELPAEVQSAADAFLRDSLRWLTRVLELGREQGEFRFEGDARDRAMTLFAALQGARQMERIHRSDVLDTVIRQVRAELGLPR